MKKVLILFVGAIAFANLSKAQTSGVSPQNQAYVDKFDGIQGHFDYKLNERETQNVNYSLTPKHPVNTAHFMVHTPEAMPFWANVTNAAGKVVYTWKPEQKVYLYNADWDLSKLSNGEYTVNVYLETEKNSVFQFKFTK